MNKTPSSERIHITLYGIRNAGKSALINALAGRTISIVADHPGTTTDPVSKAMEFGSLGPVVLTDTAGLDDEGEVGTLRVRQTLEKLSWSDIVVFVTPVDHPPTAQEKNAFKELKQSKASVLIAANRADLPHNPEKLAWLQQHQDLQTAENRKAAGIVFTSTLTGIGIEELKKTIAALGEQSKFHEMSPLEGLVKEGDTVLLVTPIDSAAPKGRLILPQVEVLRDALDKGCIAMCVRETELAKTLSVLKQPPALVITDSQAFAIVAKILPQDQPLTSFSILFARKKGELSQYAAGLSALKQLSARKKQNIQLLALEACTHNRTHEDIATVKIPALLAQKTGSAVKVTALREVLDKAPVHEGEQGFDLAVVCGGCMATRKKMLVQLKALEEANIPAINFGLFLSWAHGVFPRALQPLGDSAVNAVNGLL